MKLTPESSQNLFVCFHQDQGNTPFSSDQADNINQRVLI